MRPIDGPQLSTMQRVRFPRVLVIALVLVCCTLADLSVLHVAWLRREFHRGQLALGYFEPDGNGVRLVTDGFTPRGVDEDMALASATRLWVSPGKSVILPIGADSNLTVTTGGEAIAPYLVFGALRPAPSPSGSVRALASARRLDLSAGGLSLAAWDPTLPWEKDREWLKHIASACAKEQSKAIHLSVRSNVLRVEYGPCLLQLPLAEADISVLALLAGPATLLVENGTAWKIHRTVQPRALEIVGVMAGATPVLLFFGLGVWWCALFGTIPVLLFAWSPFVAVLGWLATSVVGGLCCAWALVRLARRSKRFAIGTACAALAGLASGLAWYHSGHPAAGTATPPGSEQSTSPAEGVAGVLLGYSAVAGGQLRSGSDGLLEHLRRLGRAYVDPLSRRAFPAQTFSRIEECICDEFDDVPRGSVVLFFGGTNDDWFSGIQMSRWRSVQMFIGWLQFMSDPHRWERSGEIFAAATRVSQNVLPRQKQLINTGVDCARARGDRFIFFHDFLASDLEGGLPPIRRQMREARKDAVTAAGGEFVDLFDELHHEAGVAWYNDIIHPSSVGHERIATRITRYLATTPMPAAGQRSE